MQKPLKTSTAAHQGLFQAAGEPHSSDCMERTDFESVLAELAEIIEDEGGVLIP